MELVAFLAFVLAGVFAYLYLSLNARLTQLVQQKVEAWRSRELEGERQRLLTALRQQAAVEMAQWRQAETKSIRGDAINRSQAVTLGKVAEHIVPYFPEFDFNPKDVRFLGTPVDFVAFDGLSDGEVQRVVFVEVKTANSRLSQRERAVRAAIEAGNVEWRELRLAIGVEA